MVLAYSTHVLINVAQAFHLIQMGNVPGSPSREPQCYLGQGPTPSFQEVASKRPCPLLGLLLAMGLSLVGLIPLPCEVLRYLVVPGVALLGSRLLLEAEHGPCPEQLLL